MELPSVRPASTAIADPGLIQSFSPGFTRMILFPGGAKNIFLETEEVFPARSVDSKVRILMPAFRSILASKRPELASDIFFLLMENDASGSVDPDADISEISPAEASAG